MLSEVFYPNTNAITVNILFLREGHVKDHSAVKMTNWIPSHRQVGCSLISRSGVSHSRHSTVTGLSLRPNGTLWSKEVHVGNRLPFGTTSSLWLLLWKLETLN